MIFQVQFTVDARRDLKKLPRTTARRIIRKIHFFRTQKNPLQFAKKLTEPAFGQFRFRVGDYRILFDLHPKEKILTILLILRIKHRREAYL